MDAIVCDICGETDDRSMLPECCDLKSVERPDGSISRDPSEARYLWIELRGAGGKDVCRRCLRALVAKWLDECYGAEVKW